MKLFQGCFLGNDIVEWLQVIFQPLPKLHICFLLVLYSWIVAIELLHSFPILRREMAQLGAVRRWRLAKLF